eukprot:CAMPEP_0172429544 /NCGR_PEP_ID=MMETSP1064-20121228/50868_1 /TAXON_ID=202472 /ORGANISM="Aulacoseira subarctica , Strain CCAP 1002/5" /LENGTH=47 /DNA_ID= /DNA_START= /DNA_END= /DNA_ORIENTATION=
MVYDPDTEGIPEIVPVVELSDKPGGNGEGVDQTTGGIPPEAVRVVEK